MCDNVAVFELYAATSYTFVVMENVSVGYHYEGNGEIDDCVYRAFGCIFEKTLERLEARGVHLSL